MEIIPIRRILIAGATGYVGGRLVRVLEDKGERVRCLARRPEVLRNRVGPDTEVVRGDLADPESLPPAFEGVDIAYYLVHSLGNQGDFEAEEERTAQHFAASARNGGVRRIIYLGGLCDENIPPSSHMRSRLRVGEVLRSSGIETIEFRASIIIGSGSLSFELIRALVQRLPIMVTPRWVSVKAQPIAIEDVLAYLEAALDLDAGPHRTYEIGGAERMSYIELMREYGRVMGLRRLFVPVPVLTPWLSSLWLGLVTPVFASIGRKLVESITTPSIVHRTNALNDFTIRPMGVHDAIVMALRNEDRQFSETHWADALSTVKTRTWGGVMFGNRIVDSRRIQVKASPEAAFATIQRIGGQTGWYYGNWLWQLRGLMDWLVSGVGMHRGRRDPEQLRLGDVIDCWRVEAFDPPRRLVLAAEMRMPGRAWLQFDVEPDGEGACIWQTAQYDPVGLTGLLYWYALYPVHHFVFTGMLRGIAKNVSVHAERVLMDFVDRKGDWENIDDVVMGGVSRSRLCIADGIAIFEGTVSLENNGGFASARSVIGDCDLSEYDGILLRIRGDGKHYSLRLRPAAEHGDFGYDARFQSANTWADVWLAFDGFRPVIRGREAPEYGPLDPGMVATLGFIVSGKQAGPFRLEIDHIKACRNPNRR